MPIGNQHRYPQLVRAEYPIEPLDQSSLSFGDTVALSKLQKCWGHPVLMNRIDFVEIDHDTQPGIEEPRPLSPWALQRYEASRASASHFDGMVVFGNLAEIVTR